MATSHSADEIKLQDLASEIIERNARAHGSSKDTLEDYRAIGEALLEAKSLLRGRYLTWAKDTLGYSKQWCARLTKLANTWEDCERARSWANENGHAVNNEFTVDGALALTRRWKTATSEPQRDVVRPERQKLSTVRAELEEARAKLAEARAEIERLKARHPVEADGPKATDASGAAGLVDWTSEDPFPSEDAPESVRPTNGENSELVRTGHGVIGEARNTQSDQSDDDLMFDVSECSDEALADLINAALMERVSRVTLLTEILKWKPNKTHFHLIAYQENKNTKRLREAGREDQWIDPDREEEWIRIAV